MIVISDTSPIIFFAKIGLLTLLNDLYLNIYVPNAVWEELINPLSKPKGEIPPDIKYEIEAKEKGWLIVKNPNLKEYHEIALNLTKELGRGEAYAIALSLELKADLLLINDKKARIIAESNGVKTIWSSEVLLDALEKGIIKNYQEFKTHLDKMVDIGLWMEKKQYKALLEKANDLKK